MSQVSKENKRLKKALREIEVIAWQQNIDWMHFHEVAMANPFHAEGEAQEFAEKIVSLAYQALGSASDIHRS